MHQSNPHLRVYLTLTLITFYSRKTTNPPTDTNTSDTSNGDTDTNTSDSSPNVVTEKGIELTWLNDMSNKTAKLVLKKLGVRHSTVLERSELVSVPDATKRYAHSSYAPISLPSSRYSLHTGVLSSHPFNLFVDGHCS